MCVYIYIYIGMLMYPCSAGAKTGRSPMDKRVVEETGAPIRVWRDCGDFRVLGSRAHRLGFRVYGSG